MAILDMEIPKKKLFEDPGFPASSTSLFSSYSTPIAKFRSKITWLRPQEISRSPRLFPENPQDGKIKQGLLGDCWFLCACEALRKNGKLLDKVIPPDQDLWTQSGYLRCRFWKFGQWVEVIIDDRLPCISRRLCFSRCRSEEVFWLPLLEKAYAKLHGCYEKLWAGQVCEALVDITGGLADRWTLRCYRENNEKNSHFCLSEKSKFELMKDLYDKSFISCSVHGSAKGSSERAEFHAFSVTDVKQVNGLNGTYVNLLKIRNMWDRQCWNGSWQAGGDGWKTLDPAITTALQSAAEDGEFWVEEHEFFQDFDELTVGYPINMEGHVLSLLTGKSLHHTLQLSGQWVKGLSAGGCRNNSSFCANPKFWLRILDPGEVVLTILQKTHDSSNRNDKACWSEKAAMHCQNIEEDLTTDVRQQKRYRAIGLHVWKVEKKRFNLQKTVAKTPTISTECHTYDREVKLHCDLTPGYYLVIPSTFMKDENGHFLLRAFSTSKISLSVVKATHSFTQLEENSEGEWEIMQFTDSWINGKSAGGSRNFPTYSTNPHLPFSILSETGIGNVRITLCQESVDGQFLPIGFHVYQVQGKNLNQTSPQLLQPVVACVPHRYIQEMTQLCTLPTGNYEIIPSTYLPNSEAQFTVTVETKIDRKPFQSQENLGQTINEVSYTSVMQR
ncbi:calpain-10 isoform X1 [Chiloscyllium plagiosum]|uniref:calpain-10 isoform X1 n=1 Tax=Chiloscyllium plagiosum TaxID=36176 RepID=UPI001CB87F57|nr:calpain-10 isoform X1 [Chiloscyllium plagiosum]XP_043558311.1 calpain-10 isoform X1 [Chiloscyllium plagiosum]XP_043558312.1 calpain-10 isoform X1 [Chiloscyllium plagiosum]XP_043558313.1 calpain-10 isoform X1 [Chiloscyllium plagiosum]XP_043558314.1 calpain-10 isoform X1 [Chiloscyllium plagiosum]